MVRLWYRVEPRGGGRGETKPLRGLAPRPSGSEQALRAMRSVVYGHASRHTHTHTHTQISTFGLAVYEVWCGMETHTHTHTHTYQRRRCVSGKYPHTHTHTHIAVRCGHKGPLGHQCCRASVLQGLSDAGHQCCRASVLLGKIFAQYLFLTAPFWRRRPLIFLAASFDLIGGVL